MGTDESRCRRDSLRRRFGRHDNRPVAFFRQGLAGNRNGSRRSGGIGACRLCEDGQSWRGGQLAGGRHRRGLHSAHRGFFPRQESLFRQRRRRRQYGAGIAAHGGHPRRFIDGHAACGCAALLPGAADAETRGQFRLRQRQQISFQGIQRLLDDRSGLHQA